MGGSGGGSGEGEGGGEEGAVSRASEGTRQEEPGHEG